LTLCDGNILTDFDRRGVAIWLKNLSKAVMLKGNNFPKRFTAKFITDVRKK